MSQTKGASWDTSKAVGAAKLSTRAIHEGTGPKRPRRFDTNVRKATHRLEQGPLVFESALASGLIHQASSHVNFQSTASAGSRLGSLPGAFVWQTLQGYSYWHDAVFQILRDARNQAARPARRPRDTTAESGQATSSPVELTASATLLLESARRASVRSGKAAAARGTFPFEELAAASCFPFEKPLSFEGSFERLLAGPSPPGQPLSTLLESPPGGCTIRVIWPLPGHG